MADQIRYDLLTQQALRGVVRNVLADAAKKGLPGEHHFYISFDTAADGVRLSDRLRTQYPEEMTIILQHQFWDLTVSEQGFEVGMSFGGIPEKLFVPFVAIRGFFDPSVQFGLQFEEVVESEATPAKSGKKAPLTAVDAPDKSADAPAKISSDSKRGGATKSALLPMEPAPTAVIPAVSPLSPAEADAAETTDPKPDKPSGGGEVVRLDRFRKK